MSIRHTGEQEGAHYMKPFGLERCIATDGSIIPEYASNTGEQEGLHGGFWHNFPLYGGEGLLFGKSPFKGPTEDVLFNIGGTDYRVFPHIKAIFTDVDGVLTDGGFYYDEDGLRMKRFCTRDAAAVHRLRNAGYLVFAVTHSDDKITTTRLEDMEFDKYLTGVECKVESIKQICKEFDLIPFRQAIYIDDDVGGLPAMREVAVSFCPADAAPAVLRHGRVCDAKGGEGVLAEVADLILRE